MDTYIIGDIYGWLDNIRTSADSVRDLDDYHSRTLRDHYRPIFSLHPRDNSAVSAPSRVKPADILLTD